MKYVYTGQTPDFLHDGRPVGFGDEVDLTKHQLAANARLIDADVLRPAPARKPARSRTRSA